MGFLLFIISSLLKWVLAPMAYLIGCILSLYKGEFNTYQKNLAIAKDQYGNAVCKYLFNAVLIKNGGYKFGNIDETISSCIGKNKKRGTLSFTGKCLDFLLNACEPEHSIKSIDETEDSSKE